MKTSLKTACIAILLMVIVMPACQKYDDGPFLSLASAKSRAVNTWKIDRVYSNGSDVTSGFDLLWPSFTLELRNDDNYVTTWSSAIVENGTWTFDNPKENIITTSAGIPITTTWNILRLKKDEMWVKFTDGSGINWEYQLVSK